MKYLTGWLRVAPAFLCIFVSSGTYAAAPQDAFSQKDTWHKTSSGMTFITPAGWRKEERDGLVIIKAEGIDASMALYEFNAISPEQALGTAWKKYSQLIAPTLKSERERPLRNGWTMVRNYNYESGRGNGYVLRAQVLQQRSTNAVVIIDAPEEVMNRREAQFTRFLSSLRAPGFVPETLVGKEPNSLDSTRTAELLEFVEQARVALDIPGLALGVVQDGEVKFSGGFGVRKKGDSRVVDASTLWYAPAFVDG